MHDAVVMKDPVTKRSRGFGFITFDAPIYVDIALEQDVHTIDSRKVCTCYQQLLWLCPYGNLIILFIFI